MDLKTRKIQIMKMKTIALTMRQDARRKQQKEHVFQEFLLLLHQNLFMGKTVINGRSIHLVRFTKVNICYGEFGPRGIGNGATVTSEGEAWSLLLPDELLEKIVIHTNERIARKRLDFLEDLTYTHDLDLIELKALLALLYFSGLQGSVRRNMKELYGKLSSPIYRAMMPRQRFEFLLTFLRFDDKFTRDQRKLTDKLAPIREIWNIFINNCKSNFKPGKNVTINEQLLSFRGRCAFRVYIKNKPDKYGLKIVVINDSETAYLIDGIPYTGRVTVEPNEDIPGYYVRKLSESISGSNRNVTCDNWFTSIPIIEKLKNEYSLTVVGTIRKDKREIPEAMKNVTEIRES